MRHPEGRLIREVPLSGVCFQFAWTRTLLLLAPIWQPRALCPALALHKHYHLVFPPSTLPSPLHHWEGTLPSVRVAPASCPEGRPCPSLCSEGPFGTTARGTHTSDSPSLSPQTPQTNAVEKMCEAVFKALKGKFFKHPQALTRT